MTRGPRGETRRRSLEPRTFWWLFALQVRDFYAATGLSPAETQTARRSASVRGQR
jgi:hypothetical protein